MAQIQGMQQMAAPGQANTIKKLTNLLGAAISVGLVIGIGIWGYKLLVRDVSGVPVIKAAEGPMRVQPEDPGGSQAAHQGLSVNDVAAAGVAADPADRLVLAPEPLELNLDDAPVAELAQVEPEPLPATTETVQPTPVAALVAQLSEGVEPLQELQPVTQKVPEATAEQVEKPKVTGGLGRSLRPHVRPASLNSVPTKVAATAPSSAASEIDAAQIPAGTRLAQLGAYESAEVARREWTRLSGEFSEYLEGKKRVIQRAQSGGRTFYRLRAMGFADLNDARRFCSALVAERAECIPVVTR